VEEIRFLAINEFLTVDFSLLLFYIVAFVIQVFFGE